MPVDEAIAALAGALAMLETRIGDVVAAQGGGQPSER